MTSSRSCEPNHSIALSEQAFHSLAGEEHTYRQRPLALALARRLELLQHHAAAAVAEPGVAAAVPPLAVAALLQPAKQ